MRRPLTSLTPLLLASALQAAATTRADALFAGEVPAIELRIPDAGIKKLAHGPTVITTLSISIVWIVYSMIPPTLLLIYATGMRGRVLAGACKVAFVMTYLSSLLALMLLWAVYPAEYDYGAATGASLKFYEASRLGELPAPNRIGFRGNTFPYERAPKFAFDDLTGGWANGGAIGTVKMTVTAAFTTTMLAWGLLTFPKGYARAGETRAVRAHSVAEALIKTAASRGCASTAAAGNASSMSSTRRRRRCTLSAMMDTSRC
jgi:hypothetical protein